MGLLRLPEIEKKRQLLTGEATLKRTLCFLAALVIGFAAMPAYALDNDSAPPAITEEERALLEAKAGKKPFPLGAMVELTQAVGGGTFVSDPNVRRAAYDVSLSLWPYWRIAPMWRLTGKFDIAQSVVENYDSTATYRNRTVLADIVLDLTRMRFYTIPGAGISMSGSLILGFPTGPVSQFRNQILSTMAKLSFSKIVGPVYLGYWVMGFKNFNEYESPTVSQDEEGEHVVLSHFQGNEQLTTDLVSVGGANVSFGIVNTFIVSWNVTDEVALAVMYQINNSFAYDVAPDDEYTSDFAEPGRGQRDSMRGIIDLTYQFTPALSVSLGTDTLVAPKTANNDSFIFPFANFSNDHRNSSAGYLALTGRY